MADNKLVISIDGDSSGLTKALTSAENRLNSFNQRVTNSSRSLTNFMKNMTATVTTMQGMNTGMQSVINACNNISTSLNQAAAAARNFNSNISSIGSSSRAASHEASGLGGSIKELILTVYSVRALLFTGQELFGGVGKTILDTNGEFEKMNILLKNVSGGATDMQKSLIAKSDMNYIWDLSSKAPYSVEALSKAFVRFKANGLDPTNGSLKSMVDAISHFGGDDQNMQHALLSISEMLEIGTVQTRQLRMLATTGGIPTAVHDMANALGVSTTKLKEEMKKGLIQAQDALPKLLDYWEKHFKGSSELMMNTWSGLTMQMQNAWKRTILRITSDDGSGSFFSVVKKQATDLINFLNSASGDKFLSELDQDLGSLVTSLSKVIKWLYEYRDTILTIGKDVAWILAINLGLKAIGSFGNVLASVILGVKAFAGVGDGAALITMLFGAKVTEAMKAVGLLTVAMEEGKAVMLEGKVAYVLSIAALSEFLLIIGAAVLTIYALNRGYNALKSESDSFGHAQKETNQALADSQKNLADTKKLVEELTVATTAEKEAALELVKAKYKEAQARIAASRAALQEKMVTLNQAQAAVDADNKKPALPGILAPMSNTLTGGIIAFGMNALGYNPNKVDNDNLANAQVDHNKQLQAVLDDKKSLEVLKTEIAKLQSTPVVDNEPDEPKAAKDKLGSLDAHRGEVVNTIMERLELQSQVPHAFDATESYDAQRKDQDNSKENFDDNRASKEEEVRARVAAITDQKQLNDLYLQEKQLKKQSRDALKDFNTQLDQSKKVQDEVSSLQSKDAKDTEEAQAAVKALSGEYNTIPDKIKAATIELEKQYRVALADPTKGAQTRALINHDAGELQTKLIAEQVKDAKDKTATIIDGFAQEDQKGEQTYQKEVDRIKNLIELTKTQGAEGVQEAQILQNYLDALNKKHTMDTNPFAKWASGVTNWKTGISDKLSGVFDTFVSDLAEGKNAFKDFSVSLIKDLAAIIIKALLAKAVLSAIGMGSGGISTASGSFAGSSLSSYTAGNSELSAGSMDYSGISDSLGTVGLNHGGGIIGAGGGLQRRVNPAMFAFAQRYHTGGIVGLGPNEVPIIAEKGEKVLTAQDQASMSTGGGTAAPVVNINNTTGNNLDQNSVQPKFDGEKWVVDIVLKHASKPGQMRDLLKGSR